MIDFASVFEPTGESPSGSDTHRHPHALLIWNGSCGLDSQQYHGLNGSNNLVFTDRDRDPDNADELVLVSQWDRSRTEETVITEFP